MQQALEGVWAAAERGGQEEQQLGTEDGGARPPLPTVGREAMALAMAVQEYRELCRLDLVSSEQVGALPLLSFGWGLLM